MAGPVSGGRPPRCCSLTQRLINAETVHVGTGPTFSDLPTIRDLGGEMLERLKRVSPLDSSCPR